MVFSAVRDFLSLFLVLFRVGTLTINPSLSQSPSFFHMVSLRWEWVTKFENYAYSTFLIDRRSGEFWDEDGESDLRIVTVWFFPQFATLSLLLILLRVETPTMNALQQKYRDGEYPTKVKLKSLAKLSYSCNVNKSGRHSPSWPRLVACNRKSFQQWSSHEPQPGALLERDTKRQNVPPSINTKEKSEERRDMTWGRPCH